MDYQGSLAYLENLGTFGINLGMDRVEALCEELRYPERKFKSVHVTGTNGKGSVSSMIADILLASGLKVGKFTSPHFVRYNERITLNGEEISNEDFAQVITKVAAAVDKVLARGLDQPTQFEVLTVAAFEYFAEQQVDYAVIEVGLGGLWDSTNVITPVVSVITNVSLDHTDRCGKTIEAIAMQKAGIIKDGVPVVTGAGVEAIGPINAMSLFKQSRLYIYGMAFTGQEVESTMEGQTFTLSAGNYHSNYSTKLVGEHQIANTAIAVVAAKLVSKQDERITEEALHAGVANTQWPGRLERIAQQPDIILDGAHNIAGATALRQALDKYYPNQKVHFVFGMMSDKDMEGVTDMLFRQEDQVYTVTVENNPRAATAQQLAELIGSQAQAMPTLEQAYAQAKAEVGNDGIVCVCGSLYLIGDFKARIQ